MAILNQRWSERMLSILRVVVALLFLQHGLAKFFGFPHVATFDNLQYFSLLGLAGLIEIVVAYFMVNVPRGFFPILNGGELGVLYCFLFLYFAVAGGGAWSLDQTRSSSTSRAALQS